MRLGWWAPGSVLSAESTLPTVLALLGSRPPWAIECACELTFAGCPGNGAALGTGPGPSPALHVSFVPCARLCGPCPCTCPPRSAQSTCPALCQCVLRGWASLGGLGGGASPTSRTPRLTAGSEAAVQRWRWVVSQLTGGLRQTQAKPPASCQGQGSRGAPSWLRAPRSRIRWSPCCSPDPTISDFLMWGAWVGWGPPALLTWQSHDVGGVQAALAWRTRLFLRAAESPRFGGGLCFSWWPGSVLT